MLVMRPKLMSCINSMSRRFGGVRCALLTCATASLLVRPQHYQLHKSVERAVDISLVILSLSTAFRERFGPHGVPTLLALRFVEA